MMTDMELIQTAVDAAKNSYSPYSNFRVGAALLCKDNTVYTGCNIENASFGATICAERTAVFTAAANGKRQFSKIAVVGFSNNTISSPARPCGICRQVLSEFCGNDFEFILYDGKKIIKLKMDELFPYPFNNF